ncbi:MAG: LOG family protein [Anaerolineales bacterium]|nr:LOG family protein [Anaerolineales bacterium]
MSGSPRRVTVFGGSRPRPGEQAYLQAYELGKGLAAAGYVVLTGGYIGTMEAVSRGAADAGGHVIGVTCDEIESWRPVKPNPWVMEELRYATLRQRLYALIDACDAALALPGGIGTLAEVTALWSQLQTGASSPRPLILIGPGWELTLRAFLDGLGEYVQPKDRQWIQLALDGDAALDQLKRAFQE